MQLDQAITEFFNGYFSTNDRSKKTEVAYKSDLEQLAAYAPKECSLSSLDAGLIENWAANLRAKSYAPASMRRKMVVLKVFCSYWVRKGVLSESPFWRVKLSFGRIVQLPRALTESEIRDLLAQAFATIVQSWFRVKVLRWLRVRLQERQPDRIAPSAI